MRLKGAGGIRQRRVLPGEPQRQKKTGNQIERLDGRIAIHRPVSPQATSVGDCHRQRKDRPERAHVGLRLAWTKLSAYEHLTGGGAVAGGALYARAAKGADRRERRQPAAERSLRGAVAPRPYRHRGREGGKNPRAGQRRLTRRGRRPGGASAGI